MGVGSLYRRNWETLARVRTVSSVYVLTSITDNSDK